MIGDLQILLRPRVRDLTARGLAHRVVVLIIAVALFVLYSATSAEYELQCNPAMLGKERTLEASEMFLVVTYCICGELLSGFVHGTLLSAEWKTRTRSRI